MKYLLLANGVSTATLICLHDTYEYPADGSVINLENCLPNGRSEYPYITLPEQKVDDFTISTYEINLLVKRHPTFTKKSLVAVRRVGTAKLTSTAVGMLSQGECPRDVPVYDAEVKTQAVLS